MLKKLIIFFLVLGLFGCGKDETIIENETQESLVTREGEGFSIKTPETWEIFTKTGIENLPNISNGKVVLVAAGEKNSGFKNNLIIISKQLSGSGTISSYDFAIRNNPKDTNVYNYFYLKKDKDFIFDDGDITRYYEFVAGYNRDNDESVFIQTIKVCPGNLSYFLTIGVSLETKNTEKYENIIKSFKCK